MVRHGGNIEEAVEKYGLKNKTLVDFSANINPLGFPPAVGRIISNNIIRISGYPDPECRNIKKSLAAYLGVAQNCLLIGNGSAELIFLIVSALKLKRALIPIPTFGEYERAIELSGGKSGFFNLFGTTPPKRMNEINKFLGRADSLFICNPNNPAGLLFERTELEWIGRECAKKGTFLIIDEAFMDFVKDEEKFSMVKSACRNKNIIVLRSLTKFFALPGLRIGYLAANKELTKKVSCFRQPWSVNFFAQLAGAQAVKDIHFIKKSKNYIFKERKKLFDALKKIAYLKPYPPSANFIFCEILADKINSRQLCDYCGRKGLLLRDCGDFRGLNSRFVRIAVRKVSENKKLIRALREFA